MKIDELNKNHLISDEGKVFRRLSDGWIAGKEIILGYTYFINNAPLQQPLLELIEHFEEIDDPAEEEIVLLDEDTPLEGAIEIVSEENQVLTGEPVPVEAPRKVTLADFHKLEKQVELLMKMIGGVE